MHIIEPCCSHRQMADLRKALRGGGRDQIRGYGDMSLTEMLPALLTGYNETEMMIVAPAIPDQAADIITTWMRWQWAKIDGSGKFHLLTRLTIIADLSEEKSPVASEWLKDNPWGDRLVLVDKTQDDTALLLPDIAITGPLNLRYGSNFVCDVTTIGEEVGELWKQYLKTVRPKAKPAKKKEPAEVPAEEAPAVEEHKATEEAPAEQPATE